MISRSVLPQSLRGGPNAVVGASTILPNLITYLLLGSIVLGATTAFGPPLRLWGRTLLLIILTAPPLRLWGRTPLTCNLDHCKKFTLKYNLPFPQN